MVSYDFNTNKFTSLYCIILCHSAVFTLWMWAYSPSLSHTFIGGCCSLGVLHVLAWANILWPVHVCLGCFPRRLAWLLFHNNRNCGSIVGTPYGATVTFDDSVTMLLVLWRGEHSFGMSVYWLMLCGRNEALINVVWKWWCVGEH
jgi:hypothetical protein